MAADLKNGNTGEIYLQTTLVQATQKESLVIIDMYIQLSVSALHLVIGRKNTIIVTNTHNWLVIITK